MRQGFSAHPVLTRRAADAGQLDRSNLSSNWTASRAAFSGRLLLPPASGGVFTCGPAGRASGRVAQFASAEITKSLVLISLRSGNCWHALSCATHALCAMPCKMRLICFEVQSGMWLSR